MACKKGVWSHRVADFGASPQDVARHVERIAEAGFDLLIPCVKNPPGYLDFRTRVGNMAPDYPAWDPLAVIIQEAHRHGMQVHPWFCVFREGAEGSRLLQEHPDFRAEFEGDQGWACACRPEVHEYVLALYDELLDNYPADGVHLDYIRTGGRCKCAFCREQMELRDVDIAPLEPITPGSEAWSDYGIHAWTDWRCERVAALVAGARHLTQRRGVELSAAVFSGFPECRYSNGQDWVLWAERDLVDALFPMNYSNSTRDVRMRTRCHRGLLGDLCECWEGLAKGGPGRGQRDEDRSTPLLEEQVRACLDEGVPGVVIFSYPALTDEDLARLRGL